MGIPDISTRVLSLPPELVERFIKLRPDYQALWRRIAAGRIDFTTQETARLLLAEANYYASLGANGLAFQLCRQALELVNPDDDPATPRTPSPPPLSSTPWWATMWRLESQRWIRWL